MSRLFGTVARVQLYADLSPLKCHINRPARIDPGPGCLLAGSRNDVVRRFDG